MTKSIASKKVSLVKGDGLAILNDRMKSMAISTEGDDDSDSDPFKDDEEMETNEL